MIAEMKQAHDCSWACYTWGGKGSVRECGMIASAVRKDALGRA